MDVTFRKATVDDSDNLADIVFGEEGAEGRRVTAAVLQLEDIERVRPLFRALWRAAENWRHCEVAMLDGQPVGVLMTNSPPEKINADVVFAAVRTFGLGTLTMVRRMRIFRRVSPKKPEGSLVISELSVLSEHRNKGIGQAMMQRAEELARAEGYKLISLQTRTTNPARRLYERFGYEVAGEALDAEFERLTGVAGNVLYVKRLE
jgi:ribosomal protein S18 acetylase RimI-like enzyme